MDAETPPNILLQILVNERFVLTSLSCWWKEQQRGRRATFINCVPMAPDQLSFINTVLCLGHGLCASGHSALQRCCGWTSRQEMVPVKAPCWDCSLKFVCRSSDFLFAALIDNFSSFLFSTNKLKRRFSLFLFLIFLSFILFTFLHLS